MTPPTQDAHPILAREGWPFIAIALIVALAASVWWGWASLPLWAVFVFVVQFFRDPRRTPPQVPRAVVAPADGRVIAIEPVIDPWLRRQALKMSVFMNVFNVHSNRSPIHGTVVARWYHPGRFLNAALDKASLENERNALHLKSDEGHDVTCVQIAGLVARRILCYVEPGDRLRRGERFGFIRFGSRVDVYLPLDSEVRVALGEKTVSGETILAVLSAPAKERT